MTFGDELRELIAKHLGTPTHGEDLQPIYEALCNASERLVKDAEQLPWRTE
jgi:hypothetical protein